MSGTDIDKWLNGETESFFNPRETPSASAGSNPRDENAPVQSLLWRFTPSATIISVAALGTATAVSLFILTRFSPDTISRHTTIPVITLHNPKSSPVAYAPLPPRETVTRPTPPEPQSEVKREDGLPTTLRPATHAAEDHGSGDALRAPLSSNLPMEDQSAHLLSLNHGARAATPTASPLTDRANAFINSYWQTIDERSDQVLPYLNSVYAPVLNYYGKSLPKQIVLRDKNSFLRRWPSRQTWPFPGAESPQINCNKAAAECVITGLRNFNAISAERSARATGVVRYLYALRFSDGSPQIVSEDSHIVAHD